MQIRKRDTAIVTGASRGLGVFIARALAQREVNLVLAARSESDLNAVSKDLGQYNTEILTVPTDLSEYGAMQNLVNATVTKFGKVDILVNNAGFDYALPFDQIESEDVKKMIELNLTVPIQLSRLVLPLMLNNNRGHIVNIASLAGVMPSAYEELYCASKHGLVGFTRSLRATAIDKHWGVSASVLCPGFMDNAGIFENMKREYGVTAPSAMGSMSAEKIGAEVINAIERDLPDVLMMKGFPRISAALLALAPKSFEAITARLNTASLFRQVAEAHVKERAESN